MSDYHKDKFRAEFGPARDRSNELSLSVTNNGYQYTTLTQSADDWRLIVQAIESVIDGRWTSNVAMYPSDLGEGK